MTWIVDHIIELVAMIVIAPATWLFRLALRDRKNVMNRLTSIEANQSEHKVDIGMLKRDVLKAEHDAAEDRRTVTAKLEQYEHMHRADSEAIHDRITEIFGSVKRIEGFLSSRGKQ